MNKKGFTLVELLAVIAILAILVIIALPNVLSMFNSAKKDMFLTEAKNIYKEVSKKYISETMKGNKVNKISNDSNKLDMESSNLKYNISLDDKGNVKKFQVSDGTYCLSGSFNNLSELTTDKIVEGECTILVVKSFSEDDWSTIIEAVQTGKTDKYKVGDTKTIDMGSYGTHTLRIANMSTPSECSTSGFSQTACGFVLEFADVITTHNMNLEGEYNGTYYEFGYNVGGWPASDMRTFINNDIYNSLPSDLKNGIIDTTVVSGHGSTSGETNFTSTDKLYLLALTEICSNCNDGYDTATDLTRQLDYYKNEGVTILSNSKVIKKYNSNASEWWLRSASSNYDLHFYDITQFGAWGYTVAASTFGVSPAFRIG